MWHFLNHNHNPTITITHYFGSLNPTRAYLSLTMIHLLSWPHCSFYEHILWIQSHFENICRHRKMLSLSTIYSFAKLFNITVLVSLIFAIIELISTFCWNPPSKWILTLDIIIILPRFFVLQPPSSGKENTWWYFQGLFAQTWQSSSRAKEDMIKTVSGRLDDKVFVYKISAVTL